MQAGWQSTVARQRDTSWKLSSRIFSVGIRLVWLGGPRALGKDDTNESQTSQSDSITSGNLGRQREGDQPLADLEKAALSSRRGLERGTSRESSLDNCSPRRNSLVGAALGVKQTLEWNCRRKVTSLVNNQNLHIRTRGNTLH